MMGMMWGRWGQHGDNMINMLWPFAISLHVREHACMCVYMGTPPCP